MFSHSISTASFFSILLATLIFSLALAGVAAGQDNTSLGTGALQNNTHGCQQHGYRWQMRFFSTLRAATTAVTRRDNSEVTAR